MNAPPPVVIAVTLVEHIDDMRFDRQRTRVVDIVEVRRTDRLCERGTLGQAKEHVQLQALRIARAMLGRPFIKAGAFERQGA